ncbi:hypothetical protein S40288_11250 [Stachybotrys chartarum IBT 40288]|nr:hypothetical protein S40288_11250 [Stachybotrys chartarum IBT 40288]
MASFTTFLLSAHVDPVFGRVGLSSSGTNPLRLVHGNESSTLHFMTRAKWLGNAIRCRTQITCMSRMFQDLKGPSSTPLQEHFEPVEAFPVCGSFREKIDSSAQTLSWDNFDTTRPTPLGGDLALGCQFCADVIPVVQQPWIYQSLITTPPEISELLGRYLVLVMM